MTTATDTTRDDTGDRPTWACQTHPTTRTGHWVRADPNYRTCSACLDRIRDQLREIRDRYAALDPRPGSTGDHSGRGTPGFGSRSPASDHVIAMRDPRSRPTALTWRGSDKRFHCESTRPPLSVPTALTAITDWTAATRGLSGYRRPAGVDALTRWIDGHLDWLTRQPEITVHAELLARLATQLRPATGEPGRAPIGRCPNTIPDDPDTTRECRARLYAPLHGDTITCRACGREWHRPEWERLGLLLATDTTAEGTTTT